MTIKKEDENMEAVESMESPQRKWEKVNKIFKNGCFVFGRISFNDDVICYEDD